jgi:hypothetical protein
MQSIHDTQFPVFEQRAIELTFGNVPDLPEAEVIKLLRSAKDNSQPPDTQDMQVDDTSPDTPPLPLILASCVSYPTSDASLRMAIREQLNHAEAIIPILVILEDWLNKLSSHRTSFFLDANVVDNEAPPRPRSGKVEIPPLDKVRPELSPNYLY